MEKYLAHISEDKIREQSVAEHAENTGQLAKKFAEAFGYGDWGYCAGILHDIGKYSEVFQRRIRGDKCKVDHATAGAQVCWEKKGFYSLLGYCIAGHHAGLPDTGTSADTASAGTMFGRRKKRVEDCQAYRTELKVPELKTPPFGMIDRKKNTFIFSVLIRMIYSCLVDADFLDTENFMKDGHSGRDGGESIEQLWEKLKRFTSDWLKNEETDTVNGHRTQILKRCIAMGENERGLYRLTVPTGGGKTVASLAFALKHAKEHGMDRVIYVIPYTSIIEQNAAVFREILGDGNVLEHHCNVDYGDREENEELRSVQLAAENWDKPVVVTTNIQFFESLFSNKSSQCRKLHNIANSVIIFDEAQMLPNDYLLPCVEMMEELVRYYKSSVVLCTATQPALQSFFGSDLRCRELCPDVEEQFRFFKRASVKNLGMISEDRLIEKLRNEEQALCILNTKKQVQRVYQKLKGEGVYHLSTAMYPKHRKRVLEQIRACVKAGGKCIVIATSLVEAGVDLDFKTVYRQSAGIDSIIQAMGRCNREGKRPLEESTAYVFELEESERVYGQEQQIAVAKQVFEDQEDITSLDSVEEYFQILYRYRGDSLDKKNILGQFQKMMFPFAKVSKEFRLIEQQTKTVFIEKEPRACEIAEEIRIKGMTKSLMREAGQYCINVYDNAFKELYGNGKLKPLSEELKEDFFVLSDNVCYTEDMGLVLEEDNNGMIMF